MINEEGPVGAADGTRGLRLLWASLAAIPYAATIVLIGFAWHTSAAFGAWPSYGRPDPKDAEAILYVASGVLMLAAVPSIVTLIVGLLSVKRLRLSLTDTFLIVVGLGGLALLLTIFSGNLGDWYID